MNETKINLENMISLNNVKGETYESQIIEKIINVPEDEKTRYLKLNRASESPYDNIQVGKNYNTKEDDLYVLKGDKPRFTKDLDSMREKEKNLKQGWFDNIIDIAKDRAAEGLATAAAAGIVLKFMPGGPTKGIGAALSAVSTVGRSLLTAPKATIGTGLNAIGNAGKTFLASPIASTIAATKATVGAATTGAAVSTKIGLGATGLGGLAVAMGSAYHDIETASLKGEIEDIIAKGIKSKSDIVDINNMFDDPYLNSIAPLLSTKDKNDNYMFPKETRDKIMELEVKKIEYSQKFTDHINRYNKIKDTSTEQELADLTKSFNEDLKNFNQFKFNAINKISNEVITIKNDRIVSDYDSISPYLMDATTFYSLKELSYLDHGIVSLDRDAKEEGINAIYGSSDIEKIKGSIKMLELGVVSNNILNEQKINQSDINKNANLSEMKNSISDLSKRIDNYNNLSNEEKAKFFNDYKELGNKLNKHVDSTISNVNKDQLDLIKHLKDKDFISTSKIDKVIENEVKISEQSIKENDLSEKVKTTINNEIEEKNQKSFSSLSNNW